jgi:Domain of unknown function (DUF4336)
MEPPVKAVSALYEPINVYKPFASQVGIADGPFEHVALLGMKMPWPFTTRMTVVQLASGELFLHSPIAFDTALARRIQSLGRVRHLVSPNRGHYGHIGEWARAFSDAIAWASPGVRERALCQRIDVRFQRDLGPQAPPDWRDEIDQTLVPGAALDEVVFFHRESKTLIVADMIMNYERERLGQPYRLIARLAGVCAPEGGMSPDLRLAFWPKKRDVRGVYEQILSWKPERIILSHGRCFDANGGPTLRRAFRWALSG